jgi:hypothetical protein
MLLAVALHEYLIDIKGVAVASVLVLQTTCINGSELNAPQTDGLAGDSYASFRE